MGSSQVVEEDVVLHLSIPVGRGGKSTDQVSPSRSPMLETIKDPPHLVAEQRVSVPNSRSNSVCITYSIYDACINCIYAAVHCAYCKITFLL